MSIVFALSPQPMGLPVGLDSGRIHGYPNFPVRCAVLDEVVGGFRLVVLLEDLPGFNRPATGKRLAWNGRTRIWFTRLSRDWPDRLFTIDWPLDIGRARAVRSQGRSILFHSVTTPTGVGKSLGHHRVLQTGCCPAGVSTGQCSEAKNRLCKYSIHSAYEMRPSYLHLIREGRLARFVVHGVDSTGRVSDWPDPNGPMRVQ